MKDNNGGRTSNGTSINVYHINGKNYPTLYLTRGSVYTFILDRLGNHPFHIKTVFGHGPDGTQNGFSNNYNVGVINNGSLSGAITFAVPPDGPNVLYYACGIHPNMGGEINISGNSPYSTPTYLTPTYSTPTPYSPPSPSNTSYY